jgi:hypothetical protein
MAAWRAGRAGQAVRRGAALGEVIIAQHRIPDETTETTQVRALLENVDIDGAVVTADAACYSSLHYLPVTGKLYFMRGYEAF